jgi:hypothetical protein
MNANKDTAKDTALMNLRDSAIERDAIMDQIGRDVASAKAAGASWANIGMALGMSKQAAQQKYSKLIDIETLPLSDETFNVLFQAPQHQNVKDLFSESEDR